MSVPPISFGRYTQVRQLGAGAFGQVHLVIDTQLRLNGDQEALLVFFC